MSDKQNIIDKLDPNKRKCVHCGHYKGLVQMSIVVTNECMKCAVRINRKASDVMDNSTSKISATFARHEAIYQLGWKLKYDIEQN